VADRLSDASKSGQVPPHVWKIMGSFILSSHRTTDYTKSITSNGKADSFGEFPHLRGTISDVLPSYSEESHKACREGLDVAISQHHQTFVTTVSVGLRT
jgi:hypothetical protein